MLARACEAAGVPLAIDATFAGGMAQRPLALGASLVREVSPRLHAKILAHGELLSTTLGAAFLEQQGFREWDPEDDGDGGDAPG